MKHVICSILLFAMAILASAAHAQPLLASGMLSQECAVIAAFSGQDAMIEHDEPATAALSEASRLRTGDAVTVVDASVDLSDSPDAAYPDGSGLVAHEAVSPGGAAASWRHIS